MMGLSAWEIGDGVMDWSAWEIGDGRRGGTTRGRKGCTTRKARQEGGTMIKGEWRNHQTTKCSHL